MPIGDFPLSNEDIEKEGVPAPINSAADKARAADGLIFAVPENNFSTSAAMKNAYDWLSRGGKKSAIYEKPVAFVSTGGQGGKNAQSHMKDIIGFAKLKLLEEPKVQIPRYSPGNFAEDGSLINKVIIDELALFLNAYTEFVKKSKI